MSIAVPAGLAMSCPYCGMGHAEVCHRVKAIEYHPDGTTKRVEFHGPAPVVKSALNADDLYELTRRRR